MPSQPGCKGPYKERNNVTGLVLKRRYLIYPKVPITGKKIPI